MSCQSQNQFTNPTNPLSSRSEQVSDKTATNKRVAAKLMIESGLSLAQAQCFFSQYLNADYIVMDDLSVYIKSCGGLLGYAQPIHASWLD